MGDRRQHLTKIQRARVSRGRLHLLLDGSARGGGHAVVHDLRPAHAPPHQVDSFLQGLKGTYTVSHILMG